MEEISINYKEEGALIILGRELFRMIIGFEKKYQNIKFICIGTDRITGDSFGPLVGNFIKKNTKNKCQVFGSFQKNVDANNVEQIQKKEKDENSLIIAIDASLSKDENSVGNIIIRNGPIKPGSGVGKDLSPVGDISIRGVVGDCKISPFFDLNFVKLGMVYEMAEVAFLSIYFALKQFDQQIIK